MIVLRVPGEPKGKDRPRFNGRTGRTYSTNATVLAELVIRAAWQDAGEPRLGDDEALSLRVVATVVRPASHFRAGGELSAQGLRHPVPRNRKPDLDNLVKLVMDALNGRAYRDDVQVAEVYAVRRWGVRAETLIEVGEIGVGSLAVAA